MTEQGTAQTRRTCALSLALVAVSGLSVCLSSSGAQSDDEAARLVTIVRQLDLIDRLARQSETISAQDVGRYHFDYARLNADVDRIRTGIHAYLSPIRAHLAILQN